MKKLFKKIVLSLLKSMAKYRLKKFKGKIIAVTGSIGKTSTKDAIFTILNTQFKVKKSKKSMNTDFGILLTILDIESGFSSATKWAWLLSKAFVHCLIKDHSEILLFELGVDKPKDMDFLNSVIQPDIAIITKISEVHMDEGQFNSLDEIFEEKSKIINAVKKGGTVILNIDDERLEKLSKNCPKKRVLTYGKNKDALFRISDVHFEMDGLNFKLHYKDKTHDFISKVLGDYQAYVLAPAIICGEIMGMEYENIVTAMERYTLPPGRMNLIEAKNHAVILDSTYNSSPEALKEALKILKKLGEGRRKVAVLGNMNELGKNSKQLHESIGDIIPEYADMLLTVGSDAEFFAKKAKEKGMDAEKIHTFKSSKSASKYFEKNISEKDLILVKGSQNKVRLERFVKSMMKDPDRAKELLVRQEKVWKSKL